MSREFVQLPTANGEPPTPPTMQKRKTTTSTNALDTLRANLLRRAVVSQAKYGTYLQPFNGRFALTDLYQELEDAFMYEVQEYVEAVTVPGEGKAGAAHPDYATRPEPAPLPQAGGAPLISLVEMMLLSPDLPAAMQQVDHVIAQGMLTRRYLLLYLLLDVQKRIEAEL